MTVVLVELHRGDPIHAAGARILRLPAWLPPAARGAYWHQPRSGYMRSPEDVERGLRLFVVNFWCGQGRTVDSFDVATSTPPSDLRCGTCVGRRLGFDRDLGCIFRPRDVFRLPVLCPGETDPETRRCFACGGRIRASTSWNRAEARHRPEPDLVERCSPCPRHGWLEMRSTYRAPLRLVCGSWRCDHDGGPL